MTKEQANEIKKVINSETRWTTYYNSNKQELRVLVCECTDEYKANFQKASIKNSAKVLTALSKSGMRPKYRTETKRYQGFINCFYLVFEQM